MMYHPPQIVGPEALSDTQALGPRAAAKDAKSGFQGLGQFSIRHASLDLVTIEVCVRAWGIAIIIF